MDLSSKPRKSPRKEGSINQARAHRPRLLSKHLKTLACLLIIAQLTQTLNSLSGRTMISEVVALSLEVQQSTSAQSTGTSMNTESPSNKLSAEDSSRSVEDETSTGSIVEFIDNNYLANNWPDSRDTNPPNYESSTSTKEPQAAIDKTSPFNSKYRRQLTADWWTKLASNNKFADKTSTKFFHTDAKTQSTATTKKHPPSDHTKRTVYKEQPLNQNIILTIRNQLSAIRSKHKVLVTRSIWQLQQLDNKLIESYKLCFKKKMPLYGGMLFRTRDFVIKMAKEVKQERKVLEAMTKQVQKVLREKLTNRTLVKEYNRVIAAEAKERQQPGVLEGSFQISGKPNSSRSSVSKSRKEVSPESQQETITQEPLTRTSDTTSAWKKNLNKKQNGAEREFEQVTIKPKPLKYTVHINEVNLKKELNKIQALIDRINGSSHELSAVVDDIVYLFKLTSSDNKKGSSPMDRLNRLDRLYNQTDPVGLYERKRARKMLKSPIKIFLEKFGRMTMPVAAENIVNSNSTTEIANLNDMSNYLTMSNPAEMKPLFEPSNLTYSEPTDQDLGFDYMASTE